MHRIQSTVSDAIVLYDSGYISGRRISSDVPARTLTILGDFKARGHSILHDLLSLRFGLSESNPLYEPKLKLRAD